MISTLLTQGHQVNKVELSFSNYDSDPVFEQSLKEEMIEVTYDLIFSFDFFPLVSKVANEAEIPYVSWVYDMPHTTLFSPQLRNPMNHVFIFDYALYTELEAKGYPCNLYHLPLPVNTTRITKLLGEPPLYSGDTFDVSFVGSLYEKCLYNKINYLPEYIKGYLEGVMAAQRSLYGCNIVKDALNDNIIGELMKHVNLGVPAGYDITYKDLFADIVNAKITSTDRIELLTKSAKTYNTTLFSGSDSGLVQGVKFAGTIDYIKEMPAVFRTSKINLNITLRSIVSGIPLRAMDICGAGGFLLSNYQPELAEFLDNGVGCVLFDNEEDMLSKIEYYLSHDKERKEIACNGFEKVRQNFSYEVLVNRIFDIVFRN